MSLLFKNALFYSLNYPPQLWRYTKFIFYKGIFLLYFLFVIPNLMYTQRGKSLPDKPQGVRLPGWIFPVL